MRLLDHHLQPLRGGGTQITCAVQVEGSREDYAQELRFTVRLERALVERVLIEMGPERAIWLLWTHFRRLATSPLSVDAERTSLADWAKAVDALVGETERAPGACSDGQADM